MAFAPSVSFSNAALSKKGFKQECPSARSPRRVPDARGAGQALQPAAPGGHRAPARPAAKLPALPARQRGRNAATPCPPRRRRARPRGQPYPGPQPAGARREGTRRRSVPGVSTFPPGPRLGPARRPGTVAMVAPRLLGSRRASPIPPHVRACALTPTAGAARGDFPAQRAWRRCGPPGAAAEALVSGGRVAPLVSPASRAGACFGKGC